ncbi:MAG: hypothetical protein ACM3YO_01420 [Bacteroidota bacterium]
MHIRSGFITIYHLYEVSDTIDLRRLQECWGERTTISQLISRRPSPEYLQFVNPPLVQDLGTSPILIGGREHQATVRAKAFDFGVISFTLTIEAPNTLEEMLELSAAISVNPHLEAVTRAQLESLRAKLDPCLQNPHGTRFMEDYLVFFVQHFEEEIAAERLLEEQGEVLAQILRGEKKRLSRMEQTETLREIISYYSDDAAIVNWNAAFIYDPEGATEHVDVLEFANSELLQLRYYDRLMDREMDRIYDTAQVIPRWWEFWKVGHFVRASQKLMALTVDVLELTDKIENAIKLTGDLYSARVYRSISRRLSLREWEENLDQKLKTAHQIYQMLIEQVSTSRSAMLELIVILLIAIEIVIFIPLPH